MKSTAPGSTNKWVGVWGWPRQRCDGCSLVGLEAMDVQYLCLPYLGSLR